MTKWYTSGRLATVGLVAALAAGCASTSDLDSIRAMAEKAQADSAMAKQTASEARSVAEESMRMSQATDERINRMFKRSMLK